MNFLICFLGLTVYDFIDQNLTQMQQEMIESAAEMLYGLIHSRYILTAKGMATMLEKYQNVDFGRCHRVHCQGQPVLPVGQSDAPRHTTVNVFCPKCRDIYFPKSQRAGRTSVLAEKCLLSGKVHSRSVSSWLVEIDGAYFGTTFPHVFLMTHSQLVPSPPTQVYVPRIYGYKVHASSEYYTGKKKTSSSSPEKNSGHRRGRKKLDRMLRS
jgi:casein kinase II subunit beta